MLDRSITYRLLLRIAGILFLLWALYSAFRIAAAPVQEIFADGGSDVRLQIEISLTDTLFDIVYWGVLFFVAAGILLLGGSSRRLRIAYGSIQLAVWLVGISLWYRSNNTFDPYPLNPFWIIVTAICSMVLLALYKPTLHLLRKVVMSPGDGVTARTELPSRFPG